MSGFVFPILLLLECGGFMPLLSRSTSSMPSAQYFTVSPTHVRIISFSLATDD